MDLNFDFNLVESSKVLFTPQMKQALKILEMSSYELYEYAEEQIDSNPVLEFIENDIYTFEENSVDAYGSLDSGNTYGSWSEIEEDADDEDQEETEDFSPLKHASRISLKDYLLLQLHTSELKRNQIVIAEYFIDNVDENGYLTVRLSEAAAFFNIPLKEVAKVLEILQTFDPPGIFARDLKECLLIQIRQMKKVDEGAQILVESYLDDLAAGRFGQVAEKTRMSTARVKEVFKFIKTLEPKPGREFYSAADIRYTVPDVIVKKTRGKYEVITNEEANPLLGISIYYLQALTGEASDELKKFIQGRISKAKWFVKCIELRKNAIQKIAEYIAERETNFFEKGENFLTGIDRNIAALELGMHSQIFDSIVKEKYFQCRWGNVKFEYFLKNRHYKE